MTTRTRPIDSPRNRAARRALAALTAAAAVAAAVTIGSPSVSAAVTAAPAPCGGVAQVTDPAGDGHHSSTDVLAAWLSEPGVGTLQATIQIRSGSFLPEHDDAVVNGSAFALLFTTGGQTRYVRATAPPANGGVLGYDYGTWSPAGGFASAGATTGGIVTGAPGTVTIDVPAATGATTGARLTNLFVLTYDGVDAAGPTWVDRAPGGTEPAGSTFGADFLVGTCSSPSSTGVASVQLAAGRVPVGGGRVALAGRLLPARAGVAVTVTRVGRATTVTRLVTSADGSFSGLIPVRETTVVRAAVEGVQSQSFTLRVRSRVTVRLRRSGTGWRLSGTVAPALPGRIQLLRVGGFGPVKTVRLVTGSRYTLRVPQLRQGRYQVVWQPSQGRAANAVSRAVRVRAG
jgi:hypothetical protein